MKPTTRAMSDLSDRHVRARADVDSLGRRSAPTEKAGRGHVIDVQEFAVWRTDTLVGDGPRARSSGRTVAPDHSGQYMRAGGEILSPRP